MPTAGLSMPNYQVILIKEADMKKNILTIIFIFSAICLQAQDLSWDIKFLKGRERESVSISQIIRMETGEVFQINITPDSDAFCYVMAYDSGRNIYTLHNAPLTAGNEILINQLQLTAPSGTETIYVIMSLERLTRLENLIQTHQSNPNSRQHTDNLRREIINLQNTASRLGEPASSFIPSGGTTRSSAQELVNRFSGVGLYVRTITIRH